jgi:hypothetical protein
MYMVHKSPSPVPLLSQMNPVHISQIYVHKIRFNIILPSISTSSKQSLSSSQIFQRFYPSSFPLKPLNISPMRPTCPVYPLPLMP